MSAVLPIAVAALFAHVVVVDFEFEVIDGEPPSVLCVAWTDLQTGKSGALWVDELAKLRSAPFPTGPDTLVIGYYASAEWGCFLKLGWPLPKHVVDLYAEFRRATNGVERPHGSGLLGALAHHGIPGGSVEGKAAMQARAASGGPFSAAERQQMLGYCAEDVRLTALLAARMLTTMELAGALLRGRYTKAVAHMEARGVPIDAPGYRALRDGWSGARLSVVGEVDKGFGVYDGTTFKAARFEELVRGRGQSWPRLASGELDLSEPTFKDMAAVDPYFRPLHDVRQALGKMRRLRLSVGGDGRNRSLLSPFGSKTGRNQPSSTRFIFGLPSWMRGLVVPADGHVLAYLDYCQQEFGIAAALSGDPVMWAAYESGDPYLEFAKQAGAAPSDATKATYGNVREQFKQCVLAVQYGMGPRSLAIRIGQSRYRASELLGLHRRTYPRYWEWSQAAVDRVTALGSLQTVFGWRLIDPDGAATVPSLQNFPMQANGSEMLRLACCFAIEGALGICAPVHDALLLEAGVDEAAETIARAQAAMADASSQVLAGRTLRTDVMILGPGEKFLGERCRPMWDRVWRHVEAAKA